MSYRSSLSYGGGRNSPYASRLGEHDRSFSDLYEYVEPSEIVSTAPHEDEEAPDVIHVKYMGTSFTLDFPPFSISEAGVTVQEVRRRVAEKLKSDPRRVCLLYKDRELKFDPYSIKRYGCKQNSEISVVVTEHYNDYGGTEIAANASSEDDSGSAVSSRPANERPRPRGNSSVRYRVDDFQSSTDSGGFLSPNGHTKHNSVSGGGGREGRDTRKTSVSPVPGRSRSKSPGPQPTATPVSRPAPADPNSPLGKVQSLRNKFYDTWVPECRSFVASPPSDSTQRDKEYTRLTESVSRYIIDAADAIELQGDQDARMERKKLIQEVQQLLHKLDGFKRK